jgi:hypothetical protein
MSFGEIGPGSRVYQTKSSHDVVSEELYSAASKFAPFPAATRSRTASFFQQLLIPQALSTAPDSHK